MNPPSPPPRRIDLLDGLLVVLLLVFAGFSALVYRDAPRDEVILSGPALEGRAAWNRHNCQACHQLHGFGGFLGPDLTNITASRSFEELDATLASGRGKMPDLGLDVSERRCLVEFLRAMDRTGESRPRLARVRSGLRFEDLPGGRVLVAPGCSACHLPFQVGRMGAPDLTLASSRLDDDEIRTRIREGRGRMPGFPHLSVTEVTALVDTLHRLAEKRSELGREALAGPPVDFDPPEVPWFEFPRSPPPPAGP